MWEAITQSGNAADELEAMGVKFIRNLDGTWFLSKRAGHSVARGLMIKGSGQVHANIVNILRLEAQKLV